MTLTAFLTQIWLIIWKSYLYRKRNWFLTLIEISFPIALSLGILTLRRLDIYTYLNTTEEHKLTDIQIHPDCGYSHLFYYPKNQFTDQLVSDIRKKGSVLHTTGFKNLEHLKNSVKNLTRSSGDKYVITFESNINNNSKVLNYSLRNVKNDISKSEYFTTSQIHQLNSNVENNAMECCTKLQYMVDQSLIENVRDFSKNLQFDYRIRLKPAPQPQSFNKYARKYVSILNEVVYPLMIALMVIGVPLSTSLYFSEERHTGILELGRMMGQSLPAMLLGYMFHVFSVMFVVTAIVVSSLKIGGSTMAHILQTPISYFVLALVIFLYIFSTLAMFSFIFAFLKKPQIASMVSICCTGIVVPYSPNMIKIVDKLLLFSPSSHLAMAFKIINTYTNLGMDIDLSNLNNTIFVDNKETTNMLNVIIWLILLSVFYFAETWYISRIYPGKFGVGKKWYFPVFDTISYCKKFRKNGHVPSKHEFVKGISICRLYKRFDSEYVVNDVSTVIKSNQITALLGHNGAGKSTVMKIMTGLISSTKGDIFLNGISISENTKKARKLIGMCPQENIYNSYMTVKEHLIYFSMLKGKSFKEAKNDADKYIDLLKLTTDADNLPNVLSGGVKRKMSLGMSLIGDSEILILDEPSSGLDPKSRHELCNILLDLRSHRTILLTTHNIEEAEILADTIMIMNRGQIVAEGSTMELKKEYKCGYKLTVTAPKKFAKNILFKIQNYIPESRVLEYQQDYTVYLLTNRETKNLVKMFQNLEYYSEIWQIEGFDLKSKSLEDVFIKYTTSSDSQIDERYRENYSEEITKTLEIMHRKLTKIKLILLQMKMLVYKRFLFTKRNWRTFFFFTVFPILVATTFLISTQDSGDGINSPSLFDNKIEISEDLYPNKQNDSTILQKIGNILNLTSDSYRLETLKTNLEKALSILADKDFNLYTKKMIISYELNYDKSKNTLNITAITNNFAKYANMIAVNKINNIILKLVTDNKNYSINTFLEFNGNNFKSDSNQFYKVRNWIILLLSILMFTIYFMTFPLRENSNNLRHVQYIYGINPLKYWLTNFLFDYFLYLTIVGVTLTIIRIQSSGNEEKLLSDITLNLMVFGVSMITFMYLMGILFKTDLKAYTSLIFVIILSVVFGIFVQLIEVKEIAFFKWFVFVRFGAFMVKSFSPLITENSEGSSPMDHSYMTNLSTIETLSVLLANTTICIILIYLLEIRFFGHISNKLWSLVNDYKNSMSFEQDDIEVERRKVDKEYQCVKKEGDMSSCLIVRNLTKVYRNVCAVNDVSFKIGKGECFGLMGVNGAGKSTLVRMLTKDIFPTHGDAIIDTFSLKTDEKTFLSKIGYCPQKDLLLDYCTGRETLRIFASIRGIHPTDVENVVNSVIKHLILTTDADKVSSNYSGGNKRKLSTAISIVGNPMLSILDEPTTGVDPVGRHSFWNSLKLMKKLQQSFLLTSHSIEECEMLCDRLSIMRSGMFRCIGTVPYLKASYHQGINVSIKLIPSGLPVLKDEFKKDIWDTFDHIKLVNTHGDTLHYCLSTKSKFSNIFQQMERLKWEYKDVVEDYVINNKNLESLFLSLMK